MRIWGGVCFHRGWSGEGAPALFATEVLKDRRVLGLTVWRRVFVHEAQTKGVREVDIVAVYGRGDWWMASPADGQRVWLSEVQDCPGGGDFLGTSGAHQRVRRARARGDACSEKGHTYINC